MNIIHGNVFLHLFMFLNYSANCEVVDSSSDLKLFTKLFDEKRREHKSAVKSLMQYTDYSKQYKMVNLTIHKIFEVLGESQEYLRKVTFIPGAEFPAEEETRHALSQTLETTCLLGEIVLHLPDVTHRILKKSSSEHHTLLAWGVFFTAHSSFLPKHTKELVHLMTQELELAEKDPNYVNPYVQKKNAVPSPTDSKPKKKKSFRRVPGKGNVEL